MRQVALGIALLLGVGAGLEVKCWAQASAPAKTPNAVQSTGTPPAGIAKKTGPVERSACSYVTRAEAEAVVGGALEPAVTDAKKRSCRYLQAGWGKDPVAKRQVSVAFLRSYFQSASDVNMRRETLVDDHTLPMVIREVPNFADEALWVWAGDYLGVLYAYRNGTTEVTVKVSGIKEAAALAAAKRFAARVLGSTAKTGYLYTPPPVVMAADGYHEAGILRRLYEGAFDRIPDDEKTRGYVVSLARGLNGACAGMPEERAVLNYGFWGDRVELRTVGTDDVDKVFGEKMEGLKASSPDVVKAGEEDAGRFVKENADGGVCMTAPVQHLYKNLAGIATERGNAGPQ